MKSTVEGIMMIMYIYSYNIESDKITAKEQKRKNCLEKLSTAVFFFVNDTMNAVFPDAFSIFSASFVLKRELLSFQFCPL